MQILKVDDRIASSDDDQPGEIPQIGNLEVISEQSYEETMQNMETLKDSQFGNKLGERIQANPKLVSYYEALE